MGREGHSDIPDWSAIPSDSGEAAYYRGVETLLINIQTLASTTKKKGSHQSSNTSVVKPHEISECFNHQCVAIAKVYQAQSSSLV